MVIPEQIKIGGIIYKIELVDDTVLPDDNLSELIWEYKTIRIERVLPLDMQLACLWHEVLHAMNNQLEETVVEFLAQGITQIILDNKL